MLRVFGTMGLSRAELDPLSSYLAPTQAIVSKANSYNKSAQRKIIKRVLAFSLVL